MTVKGAVTLGMVSSNGSVAANGRYSGPKNAPWENGMDRTFWSLGVTPRTPVVVGCPPGVTVVSHLFGTKVGSLTSGSSAKSASTARRDVRELRAHKSSARSVLEREKKNADAAPERASASRYRQDMLPLQIRLSAEFAAYCQRYFTTGVFGSFPQSCMEPS
jgi:hypothetical protein